ncbi:MULTISPECIES: single-stranded DNA-binding protein [unclassified Streptococcus]|uniref:single-stranded DNA-binding protein n=1 Tax=unclassified Streptococcus TaxID=2608887 RepID=UPI00211AA719|nr:MULTISPECIES: single-stranded DNA-binding protein [unclassified Streptococcus]
MRNCVKIIMIGRLTAQPEMNQTVSGKHLTRITLAVNRRFKTGDGEREADFITAVFWDKLAEILASYGGKGSLISIDGELRTRKYEKNGQNQYVTEVLGQSFQLLESRAQRAMRENNVSEGLADMVLDEEELPF